MKEKEQRHYKLQGIEPIEIMRQNFSVREYEGYLRGNVLKYLMRYQLKNGAEDLRKAMVYLEWLTKLIEDLEDKTVVSGSDLDGEPSIANIFTDGTITGDLIVSDKRVFNWLTGEWYEADQVPDEYRCTNEDLNALLHYYTKNKEEK